jgi:hypothetical protein
LGENGKAVPAAPPPARAIESGEGQELPAAPAVEDALPRSRAGD